MSVTPDGGKLLLYPIAGIESEEEQSKVPSVLTRSVVGISAFAKDSRGPYPPRAVISTICVSPYMKMFALVPAILASREAAPEFKNTIATPTSMAETIIEVAVDFIPLELLTLFLCSILFYVSQTLYHNILITLRLLTGQVSVKG